VNSIRWALAIVFLIPFGFGSSAAQFVYTRNVDGQEVSCLNFAFGSDLRDCGLQSPWSTYVFVGTIRAIVPASGDEEELRITPEEVFYGKPPSLLTVLAAQGPCLPKMAVGDRWLFFLKKEFGKPIAMDHYRTLSRPLAQAQKEVETLRRLQTMGDFGILRGTVGQGTDDSTQKLVEGARVVASRTSDHAKFVATTDANGYYEFQPVPVGSYELELDSIPRFWGHAVIKVSRGACWDMTLWRFPHARLSGHVRRSDGTPVSKLQVLIASEDGSFWGAETSDADGRFQNDLMQPGKYIVAIGMPGAPPLKMFGCAGGGCRDQLPEISLYYPGVHNRSSALVITLKDNEKRDNIDFKLSKNVLSAP
jgi:hypothetical protein